MALADVVLGVLVAAVWGLNFVVIKLGLDSFPPLLFSALRFVCAAGPAAFFVRRKDIPWRSIVLVGLVLGVLKYSLLFIGIQQGTPPGLASLVLQSQVIFTVVLSIRVFDESPNAKQWLGLCLAVCGIAIFALQRQGGALSTTGFALVIAAALAWSWANILLKKGRFDAFRMMVWMSLVPPLPLFALSFAFEAGQEQALRSLLSFKGWAAVLYTGLLATVLAFGIWGYLLRKYPANMVTPFALLVPVFGLASSWFLLGERLSSTQFWAAVLVLCGLALIVLGASKASRLPKQALRHPLKGLP